MQGVQAEGVVLRCVDGLAQVKVQRAGGCGRCHETGGCGGVEREQASCQAYLVGNPLGAQPGDRVLLEVPPGAALRAALLAYVLPLAAVLLGALVASGLWHSDLAGVLGALSGLSISLLYLRSRGARQACRPQIAGIL